MAAGYNRIDVICDRYFEKSLKNLTRKDRGCGATFHFEGHTDFPKDFKDDFMKNPTNKEKLNCFLADKMLELHNGDQILVVTKGNCILYNDRVLESDSTINLCSAEEADQKMVRHMLQCVRSGIQKVVVRTVDTDVIMLLLAYRYEGGNFLSTVYVWFGSGKNNSFYNINEISSGLGEETCTALPFFHAFTGCDTVSSFFNHGKCKFWDRWQEFEGKDDLTRVFADLSRKPYTLTDTQISILEKYLLSVYYANMTGQCDINYQRMRYFEHSVSPQQLASATTFQDRID